MTWIKQTKKPLAADLIWSQPQRLNQQGLTLILGGNKNQIELVLKCWQYLKENRLKSDVVLPKNFKPILPTQTDSNFIFCQTNRAGSLAQSNLDLLLKTSRQYQLLFIPGNLTQNQETQLLVLEIINQFPGFVFVLVSTNKHLLPFFGQQAKNNQLYLYFSKSQLINYLKSIKRQKDYRDNLSLVAFCNLLASLKNKFQLITYFANHLWHCDSQSNVSSTFKPDFNQDSEAEWLKLMAEISKYILFNPKNPREVFLAGSWSF